MNIQKVSMEHLLFEELVAKRDFLNFEDITITFHLNQGGKKYVFELEQNDGLLTFKVKALTIMSKEFQEEIKQYGAELSLK